LAIIEINRAGGINSTKCSRAVSRFDRGATGWIPADTALGRLIGLKIDFE
jgi:hypothetical protein